MIQGCPACSSRRESNVGNYEIRPESFPLWQWEYRGCERLCNLAVVLQEKYRKKKARKYLMYATVLRPTARSICEVIPLPTPLIQPNPL